MTPPGSVREKRAAQARELRDRGLLYREIGERLGMAMGTVSDYLYDPTGAAVQARKRRYGRECESCGELTDGSNGRAKAPPVCRACREWTPEAIVEAIKDWALLYGSPPTATEWRTGGPSHPSANTVCRRLGWNKALLRAGLPLRCDRRPETQERIERAIAEGRTLVEVAREHGCTPQNITLRLRTRGLTVRALREGR